MAIRTCKVTYSLKPETVDRVQELATVWGVPKSEVIRRAVAGASEEPLVEKKETPLEVFLRVQNTRGGLSAKTAAKFNAEVRRERRASDTRRR
jgi:predicted transcriptional regulator